MITWDFNDNHLGRDTSFLPMEGSVKGRGGCERPSQPDGPGSLLGSLEPSSALGEGHREGRTERDTERFRTTVPLTPPKPGGQAGAVERVWASL